MYETIIIGAGISGLTAAMYASRKRMKFAVIANEFGGQMLISGDILNYPGIIKTSGLEMRKVLEEQMEFNRVEVIYETVKKIEKKGRDFVVITDKSRYETKTVIIASGSVPRKLDVPSEKKFEKKGVTYCSICDGPLFAGMDVAVIGSGDSALEAIDFLKDIASKIYLVVRSEKLKGHEYLIEKADRNPKVEILYKANTKEILGDNLVTGLRYEQEGKVKQLKVRGVIIEIGRIPNTGTFKDVVKLDAHDHIVVDSQMRTETEGIFAAGDCACGHEYQYIIGAGQGAMALIKAARYLAERKD
jgi:thioredoxin reductase (NADPH)